jgi:hypothetical protein
MSSLQPFHVIVLLLIVLAVVGLIYALVRRR